MAGIHKGMRFVLRRIPVVQCAPDPSPHLTPAPGTGAAHSVPRAALLEAEKRKLHRPSFEWHYKQTRRSLRAQRGPRNESPAHLCVDKNNLCRGEGAESRGISTPLICRVCSGPPQPSERLQHLRKTNFRAAL